MTDLSQYQAVILCGGQGTRIRSVSEDKPKPLIDVGGKPILWHIMKIYSFYGIRKFVLCLGHKGEAIMDYFENYHAYTHDFTMSVNNRDGKVFHDNGNNKSDADVDEWEITFALTGEDTMTGGRLKRIARHIQGDRFFCTYGDGVSDVDLRALMEFHEKSGKLATLTGVHLPTTFGIVEADEAGNISSFREKPVLPGLINGGYFVFNKKILDYIEDDNTILEDKPFKKLVRDHQISMFRFEGFWHCMDTYKDYQTLNQMWKSKQAPWKIW
jgi:glucose-1-phosphate cytidylyltransferase